VSGVFAWQPDGNAITLDERGRGQQFSVGEGRLTLLRPGGGASQSPAGNLVLTPAAPQNEDLDQQLARYRWTLPPSPNTRCLQYRERHYDDKGLVVGTPGEWKPLTTNIEGLTHREGVRNVLRVRRCFR
jgi:Domain of unknown function (DUF4377)